MSTAADEFTVEQPLKVTHLGKDQRKYRHSEERSQAMESLIMPEFGGVGLLRIDAVISVMVLHNEG